MSKKALNQRACPDVSRDSSAADGQLDAATLSYAQLEARANILKAMKHTEAALLAISDGLLHYALIDLYVAALRELQTLLDANMRMAPAPTTAPQEL